MSTKIHAAVDAHGNPLRFILTQGQKHDSPQAIPLLQGMEPDFVLADKGYDADEIIDHVIQIGAQAVIPPKANRKKQRDCDYMLYCERWRIEDFFKNLKHYRGIATRYAKRARNFLSFIYLAAALVWLK